MKRSDLYRGIGVVVGCAPGLLLVLSLFRALTHENAHRPIGAVVMLLALLLALLNLYLSFRPWLHQRAHNGSLDGYKHVSVVPLIGTLLVMLGATLGFGSAVCAALGLLAVAIDTGGSLWLVIGTWEDASFWGA